MRWWPRTIRRQLLAGLLLLEALSLGVFTAVLTDQWLGEASRRNKEQLERESAALTMEAREAMASGNFSHLVMAVREIGQDPSLASVRISDPAGNVLYSNLADAERSRLNAAELAVIPQVKEETPKVFLVENWWGECVTPILSDKTIRGYVWIASDPAWNRSLLFVLLRSVAVCGILWAALAALLAFTIARGITRPIAILQRGAKSLMNAPSDGSGFPLPVPVQNELGDLIEKINLVVSVRTQILQNMEDALALLESMLAHAPIGLIFFDARCRVVRANQVFAQMSGTPVGLHVGRTMAELIPQPAAGEVEEAIKTVFFSEEPVHSLEIVGQNAGSARPWTWLLHAYPVRTGQRHLRWVGAIVQDVTERRRAEELLRKTEKLAATGRLAASVAHEVNNPLEALTNLLYLLHNFSQLNPQALNYVEMAEHETRRIAEITQQTLRFFRQSTLPALTNMAEMLHAVLGLFRSRIATLDLQVERCFDDDLELFCFSGELRQVFVNLVGNALDASSPGGRLRVHAHRSCNWKNPEVKGMRFTVADTGSGMTPEVRKQIYEAFFTTKEATGTGLGLWVSHEIVVKHRGLIHVRSREAGKDQPSGTVFQVFFPDEPSLFAGENGSAASQG
jgi:PAS domain S-box-containing protein